MPEQFHSGQVVSQDQYSTNLRIIKVTCPSIDFAPGQFTKLALPVADSDKPLARAYSFVNPPGTDEYEFMYDVLYEGGNLTPLLDKLTGGDEVLVSERASGLLVVSELPKTAKHLFLIGTGTGIGPFVSILSTNEAWNKFDSISLIYGVRKNADLLFQDRIEEFKKRNEAKFTYIPLVTREDGDARKMRVTELTSSDELSNITGVTIADDCQFMMCGNPEMVKDMSELLKTKYGFERNRRARPGNVTIEKYWS